MFSHFLPKDKKFFSQFNQMSKKIEEGAAAMVLLLNNFDKIETKAQEVKRIEHECDSITHETLNYLNTTFVTPFDHSDIYDLVSQMDDIMDYMETAANSIELFKLKVPSPDIKSMGELLRDASGVLTQAIACLDDHKNKQKILSHCNHIDSLEKEADRVFRKAIAGLFADKDNNKIRTIDVLKWKEVFESVEDAMDACKKVANTIESIILKSS
ncbi:MAG: DUF47 domain-containing protein [Deltaproteobacteria bacterium]|nr:DUF47 domain-containing protein [Deltaproteobacteria bacterium]